MCFSLECDISELLFINLTACKNTCVFERKQIKTDQQETDYDDTVETDGRTDGHWKRAKRSDIKLLKLRILSKAIISAKKRKK